MTDILIVGGGIGGATLALALGRRGWRVRILERAAEPPPMARPELLQEATLTALGALDVGPRLRAEAALPIRGIELRRGAELLLTVDEDDLAAAGSRPLSTDPARTRALILDAALATGRVELVRGAEVTNVVRDGTRVTGVRGHRQGEAFEERGRLIVGDDGVRSIIRGCLGIRARLRLFPVEFITFALDRPAELPADRALGWIRPDRVRDGLFAGLFLPLPGDRVAGALLASIGVWEERFDGDDDAFWHDVAALTPLAHTLRERVRFPDDLTRTRRAYGHALRYVADAAAILGDAAHPMSPAGGQGANAAIWDALALADAADAALRAGRLDARRLEAYERRRRPANRRSLWFTRRAVALVRLGRWFPGGGRFLAEIVRLAGQKRRLLRMAAIAFRDGRRPRSPRA